MHICQYSYMNTGICQYPLLGVHLSSSLSSGWRGLVGGSSSSSLVTAARLSFGRHQPNSYHLNRKQISVAICNFINLCFFEGENRLGLQLIRWEWPVGSRVGGVSVHWSGSTMTLPPCTCSTLPPCSTLPTVFPPFAQLCLDFLPT